MAAANEKAAARKSRSRAATKQSLAPVSDQPQPPAEAQTPDGVLLIKQQTPEGFQIIPQIIGNVQITEIPTIIEIGLRAARQQLGLEERK